MNIPLKDFYQEVTGVERGNSKMVADLTEWKIPMTVRGTGTGARKHLGVDLQHLEEAKAKWELAKATRPEATTRVSSTCEQNVAEILGRIRGIEVALNALMKLAKS